ncbi:MAG TPA: alpha/beta hydrolase family protein [Pseudonocardia sp.]|nr:alpha/beta hydrolase family protein [Pseudonocardia sp.]
MADARRDGPVVLVHGAWHDASCWDRVARELEQRGRRAVAVDLPAGELGAEGYTDAVLAAVGVPVPAEPVVLVGHSLGGLTVPVVAQRLGPDRVAAMVLLAPLLPRPGASFADVERADRRVMAEGFGHGQQRHEDGTTSWPPAAARDGLYRGVAEESSPGVVADAVARLRPQSWAVRREVTPLDEWPRVPTAVVVCVDDRVVDPDGVRRHARGLPGAELVELPGGHFPMLTRPGELAGILAAYGS